MGFMRHINACNQHDPTDFIPFIIDGISLGKIRHKFAKILQRWPLVFDVTQASVELVFATTDLHKRSTAVADVLQQLVNEKVIPKMHGELYSATGKFLDQPLLLIDRALAPYFGIRSYGQHINGLVRTEDGLKLWIARRAKERINYPGCLDNFVAGGVPFGLNLTENLAKECWEEASVTESLAAQANPVGAVSYNVDTIKGFNPFTLFCYDLELPADFIPRCTDGEVEEFNLLPVGEVLEIVRGTDQFKLNCNLVIIDFLIRHSYLGPGEKEYLNLLSGLHPTS